MPLSIFVFFGGGWRKVDQAFFVLMQPFGCHGSGPKFRAGIVHHFDS